MKWTELIIHNGLATLQEETFVPLDNVYEVIRINQGVLLFLNAHLERLYYSLVLVSKNSGIDFTLTLDTIHRWALEDLQCLKDHCGLRNQNIKYAFVISKDGIERWLWYIPTRYPEQELYASGVSSALRLFERETPNKKQMTQSLNQLRQELSHTNHYDFICYDRNANILEGTKTNVFFIFQQKVYTAPNHLVLGGITRSEINRLLQKNTVVQLRLEALSVDDLPDVEAAFFTGTSIGVLPITNIDGHPIPTLSEPLYHQIRALYENHVQAYMQAHLTDN